MQIFTGVKKSQKIWVPGSSVNHYINRSNIFVNFINVFAVIGRKPSASTATGNLNKHLAQQKEILEKVVGKIN